MDAASLAAAMGCTRAVADRYVAACNTAMLQAGCTTLNRAAMWHAQLGHESGGLKWMAEIWGPTAAQRRYEGRKDLGNTRPGDGSRFRGRSAIQITGRHNYTAVSSWAFGKGYIPTRTFFVDHPEQMASERYGFTGAVWYWIVARPTINPLCDQGAVTAVTKLINGGTNGLADRIARYNRARALGNRILPTGTTIPRATPAAVAAPPPPPAHLFDQEDDVPVIHTPEPKPGQDKWDWPTVRTFESFEPGTGLVKLDHGGRGGWIHLIRWWIRGRAWNANHPVHDPKDHPVGATRGHAGSERFVGYGWSVTPPAGADMVEIVTSAPDGFKLRHWRTR